MYHFMRFQQTQFWKLFFTCITFQIGFGQRIIMGHFHMSDMVSFREIRFQTFFAKVIGNEGLRWEFLICKLRVLWVLKVISQKSHWNWPSLAWMILDMSVEIVKRFKNWFQCSRLVLVFNDGHIIGNSFIMIKIVFGGQGMAHNILTFLCSCKTSLTSFTSIIFDFMMNHINVLFEVMIFWKFLFT